MLCHDIIDELERICLKEYNVHLVIHYDPVVTGDENLEQMRNTIRQLLKNYDRRLEMHDFRMVRGNRHTNLIFDIVLPYELLEHKKAILTHLNAGLYDVEGGPYYTVITFDMESFAKD